MINGYCPLWISGMGLTDPVFAWGDTCFAFVDMIILRTVEEV